MLQSTYTSSQFTVLHNHWRKNTVTGNAGFRLHSATPALFSFASAQVSSARNVREFPLILHKSWGSIQAKRKRTTEIKNKWRTLETSNRHSYQFSVTSVTKLHSLDSFNSEIPQPFAYRCLQFKFVQFSTQRMCSLRIAALKYITDI
jgi:hypothetical protein